MILIPSGTFDIGDHSGKDKTAVRRTVLLDAFYMDVHEVTVGQFKQFVDQSGYNYGGNWSEVNKHSLGDDHPMICVNWNDATAYAEWYSKDYYLDAPYKNPLRLNSGGVLRGGSWTSDTTFLRLSNRFDSFPNDRYNNIGFRCVSGSN